jgi:tetratricopeptide (TPR) repeat protein
MFMRYAGLAVITALAAGPSALPQSVPQGAFKSGPMGQLDANRTLFVVLAAANAAGYDAGIDSPSNSPLRQLVRDRLAQQKLTSIVPLRSILRDVRPKDPAAELNRYIEFSILSAGPPDFRPIRSDLPRPADLAGLDELPPLLAEFYKEAHLDELWSELQPQYDTLIEELGPAVRRALLEANAYLRNDTSGYLGHRFLVWVEPLGAPNQVQAFSYMDDDNVIVTPFAAVPSDDVRHVYLHYLLEPIAIKYSAEIQTKAALYNYAQNAPLVAEAYSRSQFVQLATECFIKAVESRIAHKPALVDQALREGYVLTPAFAEQLAAYENQETAMRVFFPDLVDKIDVKREQKRLANVQFVTERAVRTVHLAIPAPAPPPVLSGAAKTLDDAEKLYAQHAFSDRKMDGAKELFLRALQESDLNPVHAKAYYGLARVALLENDPDTAERLFHKVLELDPDPGTKSWSLLYLGRLSDNMQGGREQAQEFYKAVLTVAGVPDQVRKAAEQGLNQAFTNPK